ncbi:MAG: signal peptidase I [Frankiaceae bacterium]|nr:signal peptidase I [Frankiaceae bacterium]
MHSPHGARHAGQRSGSAVAALPAMAVQAVRALVTAALVCLIVAVVAGKVFLHLGMSPVLTGSMRPAFAPGDAIVTRPVAVSQLRPGMVVVFVPPGHVTPYAHRIVSVSGSPSHPVLATKGDANLAPDHWRVTLNTPTITQVVGSVPKVGYPLTWLREPRWRAAVIGALGLFVTTVLTRSALRSRPRTSPRRSAHAC